MNQTMQPAIQHFFQVSTLEAVSREQLEAFVEEYPCFGYGHYLLSSKLRAEDTGQYLAATQKTSLYFPNPFWLQWILENAPGAGAKPATQAAPAEHHAPAEPEPVAHTQASIPLEEPIQEPIRDEEPPFVLEEPQQHPDLETIAEPTPEPAPAAVHDADALHHADANYGPVADQLRESIEKARELRESFQKINDDFITHNDQPPAAEAPVHTPPPQPNPSLPTPLRSSSPSIPSTTSRPRAFASPSTRTRPTIWANS